MIDASNFDEAGWKTVNRCKDGDMMGRLAAIDRRVTKRRDEVLFLNGWHSVIEAVKLDGAIS